MKTLSLVVCLFLIGSVVPVRAEISPSMQAFMTEQYGQYDPQDQTWAEETDQIDMGKPIILKYKICAQKTVSTADSPRIMLAVCYVSGAPYIAGIASDFYILKLDSKGNLKIALSLTQDQYAGPSDSPPVAIRIKKLGPHLFGFIETSHNASQGYNTDDEEIYLPLKDKIVPTGGYIIFKSNKNAFNPSERPKDADDLRLDMRCDDADKTVDVYPLIFDEHGIKKGKKVSHTFQAAFDPISGKYNLPKDMIQGY